MSRVFILGPTDYDISDALRFGDVVVIFMSSRPSIFDHNRFASQFKTRVRSLGFNSRDDYFLCIGTAVPLLLSSSFLIQEYGSFKALFFHASEQRYVMRVLGYEEGKSRVLPVRYEHIRTVANPPREAP